MRRCTRVPTGTAATIVSTAQAGDKAARASIDLFVRLLGRFAGDMALVFKATGGVYVTGGVAQALGDALGVEHFPESLRDPSALCRTAVENSDPPDRAPAARPARLRRARAGRVKHYASPNSAKASRWCSALSGEKQQKITC